MCPLRQALPQTTMFIVVLVYVNYIIYAPWHLVDTTANISVCFCHKNMKS